MNERAAWMNGVALFAAVALGAAPPEPGGAQAPPAPALSGPSVEESEVPASLVRRGYDGELERLDVPPEEAALELVDLDESTRATIATILAERAAIMDRVVVDNLEKLVEIFTAVQTGDRASAARLYMQFNRELEPLRARGTLEDELVGAMPEAAATTFRALVEEYREAVLADLRRQAQSQGRELGRRQAALQEGLRSIGQEIRRSYERTIGGGQEKLQRVYEIVNATPEQQAKISDLAVTFFDETKGQADRGSKTRLFLAILQELSPDQRRMLIEAYRSGETQ